MNSESNIRKLYKEIYWAWKSMKQRCQNPKCSAYKNYGARGIWMCEEWQEFEPFCEWSLSNGYKKGLDIDRIDNDEGYYPSNCRWVTRRENVNNRRKTTMLTVNGETKARTEWERIAGISNGTAKAWVICNGKEYAEMRIAEALKNGYKGKDYSYGHCIKVKCDETGEVFESMRKAGESIGSRSCSISVAVRNKKPVKGYHFSVVQNQQA